MKKKGLVLVGILLSLSYLCLSVGLIQLSPAELWNAFFGTSSALNNSLILNIRLPRLLSCILIGSSLSLLGLYFQNLFRNPLAEAFTMGFSGAASLGVSLGILLGMGGSFLGPSFMGLLCCLIVAYLSLKIKSRIQREKHSSLVLIGISISFFCSAFVVILQSLFKPGELASSFQWLIGSFDTYRVSYWYLMLVPFCLLILFQSRYHRDLDRILLGTSSAKSLGVNRDKIETKIYFLAALTCGISVYISGIIAFVGLVAPHLARFYFKQNLHKNLFLGSLLIGASLLVGSDFIAILLSQDTLIPTGGIISMIGAPFLVFLLLRGRANG